VTNLMEGRKVPLYGDGLNVRDWIHVDDHARGILATLERGAAGEVYNLGSDNERSNMELTHMILDLMGSGKDRIEHVEDRLGHDRRYAIESGKAQRELGWKAERSAWPEGLENTVRWYRDNEEWWRRVKSGAYRDYYAKQYGTA
jgi:dTDP-glucose 4,6-dehydratase